VVDPRGTHRWPKELAPLSDEQEQIRDQFVRRWLEVLPGRYQAIERFNHGYPAATARPGTRTLEIGAGVGARLAWEDAGTQEYHAVELRPELAEELRSRHPEVKTITGDRQRELPFEDGFFDRVLAVHLLEHLPDLPRALDEVHRVLKASGTLVAVIPCEGGLAYGLARRVSAERLFEREFGTSYEWFIWSEHINVPDEILDQVQRRFTITWRTFYPLRVPLVHANLAIGLTARPRRDAVSSTDER